MGRLKLPTHYKGLSHNSSSPSTVASTKCTLCLTYGTSLLRRMTNNVVVGASQLHKNYDLWSSGYVASLLVLVASREFITGSRNAALPAFAVTVLRFPRRRGVFCFHIIFSCLSVSPPRATPLNARTGAWELRSTANLVYHHSLSQFTALLLQYLNGLKFPKNLSALCRARCCNETRT